MDIFDNPTTTFARFFFLPFRESEVRWSLLFIKHIMGPVGHPLNSQNLIVKFRPEVIVVGTDPTTGLLVHSFPVLYGIAGQHTIHQGNPAGEVIIQVPYKATLVSS